MHILEHTDQVVHDNMQSCLLRMHILEHANPTYYSGISDIRAYLNGIHIRNLLSIRTLIAKSFGVSFSIASGLVAGKEVRWPPSIPLRSALHHFSAFLSVACSMSKNRWSQSDLRKTWCMRYLLAT